MTDFADAMEIIVAHVTTLGARTVSLSNATGEILAEDVTAAHPLPPFASSSMDGFALRSADTVPATAVRPVTLPVTATVLAGTPPHRSLKMGEAFRIMTGAQIPRGADTVVMKERVTELEDGITISGELLPGSNVRRKGEEFRKGATVLRKGTLITPPVVGLLATVGRARIRVYRKARVGLIITGNEVCSPGVSLEAGQIHDANTDALSSALHMLGIVSVTVTKTPDHLAAVRDAIQAALRSSDVVITVGGISVGDRDVVRQAMAACGVQEHFWRIAMKPGKPNFFGTKGKRMVFGLPGNPVSALLSFHVLARPAIMRMSGWNSPAPQLIRARLEEDLTKRPGRMEFVRMRLSVDDRYGYCVRPVPLQESHMLSGVVLADAIYRFPKRASVVRQGKYIRVERIDWGLT